MNAFRLVLISSMTLAMTPIAIAQTAPAGTPGPDYKLLLPQQPPISSNPPPSKFVRPAATQLMHTRPYLNHGLKGVAAVKKIDRRATVEPHSAEAMNSIVIYPYQPGDLYEIYTTPLNVTDVQLQAGEEIISVAAGDTMRWELSKTISGSDSTRTEHLVIKPMTTGLNTTMIITTNWRTYHLLLKSTNNTFMAVVQWQYDDQGTTIARLSDQSQSNTSKMPVDLSHLDFSYKVRIARGSKPDWMPTSIFNDGSKTYVEFPQNIQSAPTLFIKQSGSGDAAVNYRVVNNYYVVDQVFTAAELVSGDGQTVLEIYSGK